MNFPPAKSRRQPNAPSPPVVLPDELVAQILSRLPVKPLMRLRCVSKSWNTLISDPTFLKMHLQRSARNAHLTLMWERSNSWERSKGCGVVLFPVRRLLENQSIPVTDDTCYRLKDRCRVVGSCNGLLCLHHYSFIRTSSVAYRKNWLCFWNPATRTRSEKLGVFRDFSNPLLGGFKFTFGYDNSTGTYKVVAFRAEGDDDDKASWRSEVRVFSLGDNCWRNIPSFPVVPLNWLDIRYTRLNDGVHLSGTVNWLALRNNFWSFYDWKYVAVEQFAIVSLDLSTETYRQLLLPRGFDEVPRVQPTLQVLMDCLCFSHDFKGTDFVIWQMKEYGVQESWTQLLKISYQDLQMYNFDHFKYDFRLLPLCLSENGDSLILANEEEHRAIIYNRRDNRVERTRNTNEIWWVSAKDYVETLVSTC